MKKQQIQKKKRHFTIIELMIVIVIISMLTAVLAYNMIGIFDKGKAAKTRFAIERLETILNIRAAEDPAFLEDVESNWEAAVVASKTVKNPKEIIHDGWGKKFDVKNEDGKIVITSEAYNRYLLENPGAS